MAPLCLLRTFLHMPLCLPNTLATGWNEWRGDWKQVGTMTLASHLLETPPGPLHFACLSYSLPSRLIPLPGMASTHSPHSHPSLLQAVVQSCLQHLSSLSWGPQGPLFLLWGLCSRHLLLLCGINPHSTLPLLMVSCIYEAFRVFVSHPFPTHVKLVLPNWSIIWTIYVI